MTVNDLIKILEQYDGNSEISITDNDQNNTYEIIDFRTCEDNTSEYYKTFLDIVIDL